MSKDKEIHENLDIQNPGGDGIHINPVPGRDNIIRNTRIVGAHGHGVYSGAPAPPPPNTATAPSTTPPALSTSVVTQMPPPASAPARPAKKIVAALLGATVIVVGLLANSAQVLDSPTYRKLVDWVKK